MNFTEQLKRIDRNDLTAIVRKVLGSDTPILSDWRYDAIAYASVGEETRGLFRLQGTALDGGQTRAWSVVLKAFRALADGSNREPMHAHYWKREPQLYASNIVKDLPQGLTIPCCFGVQENEQGLWLWLEDVQEALSPPWPLERYGEIAHLYGQYQAHYLTGRSALPPYAWLSRDATRAWALENAYLIELLEREDLREHPNIRRAFPTSIAECLLTLWAERERFNSVLARLPQTFCHHDAGHRNLLARENASGAREYVLLDWELAGQGAIGEELANLVIPALINFEVPSDQAQELEQTVLSSYLSGLQSEGWKGNVDDARMGYSIAAVFRWAFAAAGWPLAIQADESGNAEAQTFRQWGRPMEEVRTQWAGIAMHLLNLIGDEQAS